MTLLMTECNVPYEERGDQTAVHQIVAQAQALTTADRHVLWLGSWVAANKVYSLFDAVSAEQLRQTAMQHNFRFHQLLVVKQIS